MVLLGEHLGRGQQGGLSPGVDDLEHRAQRDHGLAGADLALEEPVHRVVAAELLGDEVADLALATGELERQAVVEGGEQPRRARPGLPCAPCARCAARRRASTSWSTSASSKRKRFCAAPSWLHSSGPWIQRSACMTVQQVEALAQLGA